MNIQALLEQKDNKYDEYLLLQDHLYNKIPDNQRFDLIRQAVECGKKAAENIKTTSLWEYCRQEGITIDFFQEEIKVENFRFVLAEFQLPNHIRINQSLLQIAKPLLLTQDFLKNQQVSEILLAHELYHYLENQQQLFTVQKQLSYRTGPFKRRARLYSLSEIAAMNFAREYFGLSFSPVILNIFLIYPIAPEHAEYLVRQLLVID